MQAKQIDPEGSCLRARRQLQQCLMDEGSRLSDARNFDQALVALFNAYSLRPGAVPILHTIGKTYAAMGDSKSALTCRRGVIPKSAEARFFGSTSRRIRPVRARRAIGCKHIVTHRSECLRLKCPSSNGNPKSRPEFRAKKTESRGSFISVLQDGGIWFDGFNTVVFDRYRRILREHVKGNQHVVTHTLTQRHEQFIDATVCFIDARSSPIYYHWISDVLPKIAVLEKGGIDLRSIDYYIVNCSSSFQKQSLEHLGITDDRILPPWSEGLTRCRQLIVPFLKHDRGDRFYNGLGLGMASWVPHWLKNRFVSPTDSTITRLYISRGTQGSRSVVEEQELLELLSERGFSSVSLESLTVIEQASLLANVDIVVAPHGAGLTNIAFCKQGATIIEIFGNHVVSCYWAISELTGLRYHAYFAHDGPHSNSQYKISDDTRISLYQRRQQNIHLNVNKFMDYLDQVVAKQYHVTRTIWQSREPDKP